MRDLIDRLATFPQAALGHAAPTPLERANRLSDQLGIDLWLKRDDVTGLGMGGNKVRQLAFYFGDAIAKGADAVLITGAVQSNFMRTAAAAGAKLGLSVHLQLEERVPSNDPLYNTGGNVFLDDLFGAERRSYPAGEDEAGADRALVKWAEELQAAGRKPYIIPLGPGHPPLGALGYCMAAAEYLEQAQEHTVHVVASGSGASHGGLMFGLRALGLSGPGAGHLRAPLCRRAKSRVCFDRCREIGELLDMEKPRARGRHRCIRRLPRPRLWPNEPASGRGHSDDGPAGGRRFSTRSIPAKSSPGFWRCGAGNIIPDGETGRLLAHWRRPRAVCLSEFFGRGLRSPIFW